MPVAAIMLLVGTVSVFEDQERAEESNRVAEEWVNENLGDLLPTPPNFAAGERSFHAFFWAYFFRLFAIICARLFTMICAPWLRG